MFNLLIIINLLNFYKIGRIQDPIKTIAQNFTIFYISFAFLSNSPEANKRKQGTKRVKSL